MDRMKTFGKFLFIVIAFFIFSNVMIDIALKTSYNPIDSYIQVSQTGPVDIQIDEAKATFVNGYVGGKIVNISGDDINNKYLKLDMFSERNVLLGTKYINVNNLKANNEQEFRMGFKYTDVDYCRIDLVDEIQKDETTDSQFLSEDLIGAKLLATVILLCYM